MVTNDCHPQCVSNVGIPTMTTILNNRQSVCWWMCCENPHKVSRCRWLISWWLMVMSCFHIPHDRLAFQSSFTKGAGVLEIIMVDRHTLLLATLPLASLLAIIYHSWPPVVTINMPCCPLGHSSMLLWLEKRYQPLLTSISHQNPLVVPIIDHLPLILTTISNWRLATVVN